MAETFDQRIARRQGEHRVAPPRPRSVVVFHHPHDFDEYRRQSRDYDAIPVQAHGYLPEQLRGLDAREMRLLFVGEARSCPECLHQIGNYWGWIGGRAAEMFVDARDFATYEQYMAARQADEQAQRRHITATEIQQRVELAQLEAQRQWHAAYELARRDYEQRWAEIDPTRFMVGIDPAFVEAADCGIRPEAEARAQQLLISLLPKPLRKEFEREGILSIEGASGKHYLILSSGQTSIFDRPHGRLVGCACLQLTVPAPVFDRMIAEYLLITNDERLYLRTANVTWSDGRYSIGERMPGPELRRRNGMWDWVRWRSGA